MKILNIHQLKSVNSHKWLMILSYFSIILFISQTAAFAESHLPFPAHPPHKGVFNGMRYKHHELGYNDTPTPKMNDDPFSPDAEDEFDAMLAAYSLMTVQILPQTAPINGMLSRDALSLTLAYISRLDYLIGTMEWAIIPECTYYPEGGIYSDAMVHEDVLEMVSQVRNNQNANISNARIGNYKYSAGKTINVLIHSYDSTDRTELHNKYVNSGLNVSMPDCYPYNRFLVHANADRWPGGNEAPNVRAALLWAPLDIFTVAKNDLPEGHELIPWISEFWWTYKDIPMISTEQRPTVGDNIALLQHLRLRGADGFDALLNFDDLYYSSRSEYYQTMVGAWCDLDDGFEENGINVPLNLSTNRAAGVEWSAVRNRNTVTLLISNMNTVGSFSIANNAPGTELAKFNIESSAVVSADTHQLFTFNISNLLGNGDFEGANIDWTLDNGSLEEGEGVNNTDCLKIQGGYEAAATIKPIYVESGEQIKIGYYAKGQSGAVLGIRYRYYNSSDVHIGTVNVPSVIPGSTYKRYESNFTVLDNPDIDHIKILFSNIYGATDANDIIWLDDMVIRYFAPNLLDNGNFESGTENWDLSGGIYQAIWEPSGGINNNHGLKLPENCLVTGMQKIYAGPGERLKLNYYAKGLSDTRFLVQYIFYDISGNSLGVSTAHNTTLSEDYQKYESTFVIPNTPGIAYITPVLVHNGIPASTMSVDNISISKAKLVSFQFNENSGTTTKDEMNNVPDGVRYGTPSWEYGISGAGLYFDGVNDYVSCGNTGVGILDMTGSRTISAWIKPLATNNVRVIAAKYMWGCSFSLYENKLYGYIRGSNVSAVSKSSESIGTNEWHHVAMTFDVNGDKKIHLYLDGVEVSSYLIQTEMDGDPVTYSNQPFIIGSDGYYDYLFDGIIDELEIFACSLSSEDISDMYEHPNEVVNLRFNENSGIITRDEMNNIPDGVRYGTPSWEYGISGASLYFDGVNDYVSFGNTGVGILDMTGSRTISAWIRPLATNNVRVIAAKYIWGCSLALYENRLYGYIRGSNVSAVSKSSDVVTTNEWHHVAMTFDVNGDKKIHLYLDGVEVSSYLTQTEMDGSPVTYSNMPFTIGSDYNAGYLFDGKIDEVKIFARSLSSEAISDMYEHPVEVVSLGFNENSGTTTKDGMNNIPDGVRYGTPAWSDGISGAGLYFDGVNDYVSCGNTGVGILDMTGSRTISAWIKPLATNNVRVIAAKYMWGCSFSLYENKLYGYIRGSNVSAVSKSSESIGTNEWHHVAMTFDVNGDKKIHLYLDGAEVSPYLTQTEMDGDPVTYSNQPFVIGSDGYYDYLFDGIIDEVKVFDKALDSTEIYNSFMLLNP